MSNKEKLEKSLCASIDALNMAIRALEKEALEEHSAKVALRPSRFVTRDMCRCGMTTGTDPTPKCEALRELDNILRFYEKTLQELKD